MITQSSITIYILLASIKIRLNFMNVLLLKVTGVCTLIKIPNVLTKTAIMYSSLEFYELHHVHLKYNMATS